MTFADCMRISDGLIRAGAGKPTRPAPPRLSDEQLASVVATIPPRDAWTHAPSFTTAQRFGDSLRATHRPTSHVLGFD